MAYANLPNGDATVATPLRVTGGKRDALAGTTIKNPVLTGNKTVVYFNGQPIGYCVSVRCSDSYNPEPAAQLGSIIVPEYVPTMADYTISVGMMALEKSSLYGMPDPSDPDGNAFNPVIPVSDTLVGETKNHLALLEAKEFVFAIYGATASNIRSSLTSGTAPASTMLCAYYGVSYAAGELSVEAHRIVTYNATFKARRRTGSLSSN